MALTLGSVISRAEYNAIQSKIESVLGDNGVNDQFGYGRATESSQITKLSHPKICLLYIMI
jgi:hypothetical protein